MKIYFYKNLSLFILLFFGISASNILLANDFSIEIDDSYFNPLAVSFKWNINLNNELKNDEKLNLRYELTNNETGNILFSDSCLLKNFPASSVKIKTTQFYCFVYDINSPKGEHFRFETIPSSKVNIFTIPDSGENTKIDFNGPRLLKCNYTERVLLFQTGLFVPANIYTVNSKDFMRQWITDNDKKICNLKVSLYLTVTKSYK